MRHLNLASRLSILVVLTILPALALQAWNEFAQRRQRQDEIKDRVMSLTKEFAEEIGVLREGASDLLSTLGELEPVKDKDTFSCRALMAHLKEKNYAGYDLLGAADQDGRVFCASRKTALTAVTDRSFYRRAMASPGLAVGEYWVDPEDGQQMIFFGDRFEDADSEIGGVVFAGLDLGWLTKHLQAYRLESSASILIADREGNIIARLPHPEAIGKNMRASHEKLLDSSSAGWEESVGVDGVRRIYGYIPPALHPGGFFLSAGMSKDEAFAKIDATTQWCVTLLTIVLFVALHVAWAIAQRANKPIIHLSTFSHFDSWRGHWRTRPPSPRLSGFTFARRRGKHRNNNN